MCIKKRNLSYHQLILFKDLLYLLFQIPVAPLSDWPVPSEQNNSCLNVVKKVSG